ncbi:MAG: dihydrofolate reductase [Saprospiraceae bacterium]|jgi:dihydrofolate reductase
MRKIIVNLCCSLDSYIEGANREINWCFTDQDYGMTDFLNRIDSIIFGRHSYVQLLEMAPDAFKDKRKIVISKTLQNKDYDALIISKNIKEEIENITSQSGKDIWFFGGANLMSTFINLDLIDELMIAVHPLILGSGKPLFTNIDQRKKLKLMDSKSYSSGLVMLQYQINKSTER